MCVQKLKARAGAERKAFRKELEQQFKLQVEQVAQLQRENKELSKKATRRQDESSSKAGHESSDLLQKLQSMVSSRDAVSKELEMRTNELKEWKERADSQSEASANRIIDLEKKSQENYSTTPCYLRVETVVGTKISAKWKRLSMSVLVRLTSTQLHEHVLVLKNQHGLLRAHSAEHFQDLPHASADGNRAA